MGGLVTLDRVASLSDAERVGVHALTRAVYPPELEADWPGHQMEWSPHEWCVRIRGVDGALVSYVGLVVREAAYDGTPVRVGGIGGVQTHPAWRRRGFAALGVQRAVAFFQEQPALGFALLVCRPHLRGYYTRLGWHEFVGRLLIRQRGAVAEFTGTRVMTQGIHAEGPSAGTIDLCGPPW